MFWAMSSKILCVDDEEVVRQTLAQFLGAKGHTVGVAQDGAEALACAATTQFDVVITDHQMPRMTGLELIRQLRATAYSGKIIVFSGAVSPALRKEYEMLRIDAIAKKPSGLTDILALLQA